MKLRFAVILILFLALATFGVFTLSKRPKTYTEVEKVREEDPAKLYLGTFIDEKYKNPPKILFDDLEYTFDESFDISANYSFVVNLSNNKVLFSKNSRERVPVASLVKVMTAVVALEHASSDTEIIVSEKAANIGENSMSISAGEIYTLEELIYGLILNSGNDAATAIAEGVSGSEEYFVKWMNMKAKDLWLSDTRFSDPSGLNKDDKEYYSTAYDLAIITKYALDNFPLLNEVFSTFNIEFPESDKHKYVYLENQTNLLTTYPGVKGVKTGYTDEAGWSLITYAENDGVKILGVILDAVNRRYDAVLLLDYYFGKEGVEIHHDLL